MSYSQGVIGNTKNYGNKKGKQGQVEHTIGNTIGRIGNTIGIRLNIGNPNLFIFLFLGDFLCASILSFLVFPSCFLVFLCCFLVFLRISDFS